LTFDRFAFDPDLTPKLELPNGIRPTLIDRTWYISPFDIDDPWLPLIAIAPGCLLFLILFIETEVTE
jgi:sodium bicarbonate transporter 10